MEMFEPTVLLVLALVAFFAGFIDAVAGGGGMLTVPVLLSLGLPPHVALGTNKLAATFASSTAAFTYYKKRSNLSLGDDHLLPLYLVPLSAPWSLIQLARSGLKKCYLWLFLPPRFTQFFTRPQKTAVMNRHHPARFLEKSSMGKV